MKYYDTLDDYILILYEGNLRGYLPLDSPKNLFISIISKLSEDKLSEYLHKHSIIVAGFKNDLIESGKLSLSESLVDNNIFLVYTNGEWLPPLSSILLGKVDKFTLPGNETTYECLLDDGSLCYSLMNEELVSHSHNEIIPESVTTLKDPSGKVIVSYGVPSGLRSAMTKMRQRRPITASRKSRAMKKYWSDGEGRERKEEAVYIDTYGSSDTPDEKDKEPTIDSLFNYIAISVSTTRTLSDVRDIHVDEDNEVFYLILDEDLSDTSKDSLRSKLSSKFPFIVEKLAKLNNENYIVFVLSREEVSKPELPGYEFVSEFEVDTPEDEKKDLETDKSTEEFEIVGTID